LALKAKRNDCSINTPSGPSKIIPAPLPLMLNAPSTDKVQGDALSSPGGVDISKTKSASI
ncbi:hypothetical protein A2U01_0112595, partial [Trifolium medium]|nr:hypothetical protein [Trifolium medium]